MSKDENKSRHLVFNSKAKAHLEESLKKYGPDKLDAIFNMQKDLLKRYGFEAREMTYEAREKFMIDLVHAQVDECQEFLGQFPWKHWKKYPPLEARWNDDGWMEETKFELADQFFFLMDQMIMMGMNPEEIFFFYAIKSWENFRRQDEGYGSEES